MIRQLYFPSSLFDIFKKIILFISLIIFIIYLFYSTTTTKPNFIFTNDNKANNLKEKKIILKIAQVSSLVESAPPKKYGGTERIASYITEELVKRGHEVTLFATNDSVTTAKLVANSPAFGFNNVPRERYMWLFSQIESSAKDFDIIHFHLTTYYDEIQKLYREGNSVILTTHSLPSWSPSLGYKHKDIPLVSISKNQQKETTGQPNFVANIYHGLPLNLYKFVEKPKSERPYLAYLGRISPSKLPDWAIKIALKSGYHLKMAAKYDKGDKYWEEVIKPLIEANNKTIEYLGEVNDKQKNEFLGNAIAFIFPINWSEPFGMVMTEAMACGTPVIGRKFGSVPEVIDEGITGYIFDTIEQGVEAVKKIKQLDRFKVRKRFEERFSVEKMVDNYENIYKNIINKKT